MGTIPPDSIHFLFKESDASTSRIDYPSDSISESTTGIHLPQELITQILARLPVKSLLKFKCVSKLWLSLITDPQFIRSHFAKSSSIDEVENLELLFSTKTGMNKCCLYSALHEPHPSNHVSAIEFPAKYHKSIVGIINGLVCLNLKGTDLCLWNPALNKIKHLNVHPEAPSGCFGLEYNFSFGYDESNDDYKVVCVQTVVSNFGVFVAEVRIYSLKAGSWRRLHRLTGFYLPYPGVFAYGKIYWCRDIFEKRFGKIISLDMSSEKFVELQPPKYEYVGVNCLLRMGQSGGRPFVLCDYYKRKTADLWVLDKRGVDECWCKLVSIPHTDVKDCFDYRVLCISCHGEIVFGIDDGLLVYNWKKKESRNIKLGVGMINWGVNAYVESLIWPNYAQRS